MTDANKKPYYEVQAFRPENIPRQRPPLRAALSSACSRLMPWGSTQQTASLKLFEDSTPESMRLWEKFAKEKEEKKANGIYVPATFEGVDLHNKCDNKCFRFAPLPFRSQFWIITLQFGRGSFFVFLAALLLTHPLIISASREGGQTTTIRLLSEVYPIFLGIPLLLWSASHIVVNHFPRLWFRPPKGPDWELNRKTGLVTIFDYKRHRKEGVIDEFVAPFYEFDAYMTTTNNRHGPTYGLLLQHRYEDRKINFHMLINADDFQQRPCALWDFLQNYMDTSGPIPDIPLFEPYRHLDPVTASHDQQNRRNPRYWIDMDDATFKVEVEVDAMWQRVYAIDTFSRPNLMARYVDYGV